MERDYDIYRCKLAAIVKFTKIYSYMLNAKDQSIIYMDYKPFVGFFNVDYHENIFVRWANKLRLLNIRIQYIASKKNIIADDFS